MRRTRITLFLAVLCLLILPFSVSADESEPIRITLQPQNPAFPENGYASWSVEAEGGDLTYEWFIVYQGMTYETSKAYAENQTWLEAIRPQDNFLLVGVVHVVLHQESVSSRRFFQFCI